MSGDGNFQLGVTTIADNDWIVDICASGDDTLFCDDEERTNLSLTGRSCTQATFGPKAPAGGHNMGRVSAADTTAWSFAGIAIRPAEASDEVMGEAGVTLDVSAIDVAGEQLFSGYAAVTFDVAGIAATGAVAARGPASISPPVSAIAASGIAPIGAGPASVTPPVSAIAASGGITTAGTGSLTFSVSAVSAAGGVTTSGAVAVAFVVSTLDAAGGTDPDFDTVRGVQAF